MIIQVVLVAGLIACLAYALVQRKKSRHVSAVIYLTALAGIGFVMAPETTNRIAHAVGVGRGADLILYCWLVISLVVSINLHFRIIGLEQTIATLARELALRTAIPSRQGTD